MSQKRKLCEYTVWRQTKENARYTTLLREPVGHVIRSRMLEALRVHGARKIRRESLERLLGVIEKPHFYEHIG